MFLSCVQWHTAVILAVRKWRQEDREPETSLDRIARPFLKTKPKRLVCLLRLSLEQPLLEGFGSGPALLGALFTSQVLSESAWWVRSQVSQPSVSYGDCLASCSKAGSFSSLGESPCACILNTEQCSVHGEAPRHMCVEAQSSGMPPYSQVCRFPSTLAVLCLSLSSVGPKSPSCLTLNIVSNLLWGFVAAVVGGQVQQLIYCNWKQKPQIICSSVCNLLALAGGPEFHPRTHVK